MFREDLAGGGVLPPGYAPDYEDEEAALVEEYEKETEDDRDRRILEIIRKQIDAAEKSQSTASKRRQELYRLYRGKDVVPEREGRSQVCSSDVLDAVEWVMPSMMKIFLGTDDPVKCDPIGDGDARKAELHEKLINYQFVRRGGNYKKTYTWIKDALLYGFGVVKLLWADEYATERFFFDELSPEEFESLKSDEKVNIVNFEEEERMVDVPPEILAQIAPPEMMGDMPPPPGAMQIPTKIFKKVSGERRSKTYSGPDFQCLAPEDFFYDPEASDLAEAKFCAHRTKRTLDYLRQKEEEGIYEHIDKVAEKAGNRKATNPSESVGEKESRAAVNEILINDSLDTTGEQRASKEVEVFEWWGLLDVDDTGRSTPYLVVVAEDIIIRKEPNPFAHGQAPFSALCPILDTHRLEGIGLGELVAEFQKIKTSIYRQTLDNLSFINNQMWEVDRNAGVDVKSLLNPRPGGVVRTNRLGAFKAITPAPIQGTAFQAMEFIQTQLEQRTGITRYNQGLDSQSLNKTATGISAIMGASQQRIELIARTMAETGFRDLFRKWLSMNQQFIDQAYAFRVLDDKLMVTPDDLSGAFDVNINVAITLGRKAQEEQQMVQLLQMAPQLAQAGLMSPLHVRNIMELLLRSWGYKDIRRFIAEEEQVTEAMQQQAAMMQQQTMMQQGGTPDGGIAPVGAPAG